MRFLAYCTLGHIANITHNVYITGVCRVCKSTPNEHTKVQLPTYIHTTLKFTKLVDPIRMKMPKFRPICLIIQEFKEKSTFLHDTP